MEDIITIREANDEQIKAAEKKAAYLDDDKLEKTCSIVLYYGKDAVSDECLNTKIDRYPYVSLRNFLNSTLYSGTFAVHLHIKGKKIMVLENYGKAMTTLSNSLLDDYAVMNYPTAIYSEDHSQPYYDIEIEQQIYRSAGGC